MKNSIALHWFRQDLRLRDNPALWKASKHGSVIPIYILDDSIAGIHGMGAASRWWLHHSLQSLNHSLDAQLSLYRGNPLDIIVEIIKRHSVDAVYWNRCYEPWRIHHDTILKKRLIEMGVTVESHNGSLLWEPWKIKKKDGTPYRVFTPFYHKGCLGANVPREPLPKPQNIRWQYDEKGSLTLEDLGLLPQMPQIRWDRKFEPHWQVGEIGAEASLKRFLIEGIGDYKKGRDFPSKRCVSRISPHLHFGEISPNRLWYAAEYAAKNMEKRENYRENIDHFCSELGWREFSYSLLYHNPHLPRKNLQSKFDSFPWQENPSALSAWQSGHTGIPIVDAGMRELWETGYMHNRVRMVVGSFLVKNLRIDWRHGARWFWDCLVDADLANNSAGWQWIAGCGADAAPYFRIFNPVMQGQKFDPDGEYIRRFVPELKDLPKPYLYSPWEAPENILTQANVKLGVHYPQPIVDLKKSREAALEAFQSLS